jgi:hypothetical protein
VHHATEELYHLRPWLKSLNWEEGIMAKKKEEKAKKDKDKKKAKKKEKKGKKGGKKK